MEFYTDLQNLFLLFHSAFPVAEYTKKSPHTLSLDISRDNKCEPF